MILVTGATGNVGRNVVSQLLEAGEKVRVLTRNPGGAVFPDGVEVVQGDLASAASNPEAFKGIDGVQLMIPFGQSVDAFAGAAASNGVRRIVVLSSEAVNSGETNNPIAQHHLQAENAVKAADVEWTFVRPGAFAANTLLWAPNIRAESVVREPYALAKASPIHEADIAAVATTALTHDGHAGRAYTITGPESVTQVEQAKAIAAAIGRDIRFVERTPEQAREEMLQGMPPALVDILLRYKREYVEKEPPVTATVKEVTGVSARTFAQWAVDHADDFR